MVQDLASNLAQPHIATLSSVLEYERLSIYFDGTEFYAI